VVAVRGTLTFAEENCADEQAASLAVLAELDLRQGDARRVMLNLFSLDPTQVIGLGDPP
jgi:hypothetical protein